MSSYFKSNTTTTKEKPKAKPYDSYAWKIEELSDISKTAKKFYPISFATTREQYKFWTGQSDSSVSEQIPSLAPQIPTASQADKGLNSIHPTSTPFASPQVQTNPLANLQNPMQEPVKQQPTPFSQIKQKVQEVSSNLNSSNNTLGNTADKLNTVSKLSEGIKSVNPLVGAMTDFIGTVGVVAEIGKKDREKRELAQQAQTQQAQAQNIVPKANPLPKEKTDRQKSRTATFTEEYYHELTGGKPRIPFKTMTTVLGKKPLYPREVLFLQEHADIIPQILESKLDVVEYMDNFESKKHLYDPYLGYSEVVPLDNFTNPQQEAERKAVLEEFVQDLKANPLKTQELVEKGKLVASNSYQLPQGDAMRNYAINQEMKRENEIMERDSLRKKAEAESGKMTSTQELLENDDFLKSNKFATADAVKNYNLMYDKDGINANRQEPSLLRYYSLGFNESMGEKPTAETQKLLENMSVGEKWMYESGKMTSTMVEAAAVSAVIAYGTAGTVLSGKVIAVTCLATATYALSKEVIRQMQNDEDFDAQKAFTAVSQDLTENLAVIGGAKVMQPLVNMINKMPRENVKVFLKSTLETLNDLQGDLASQALHGKEINGESVENSFAKSVGGKVGAGKLE